MNKISCEMCMDLMPLVQDGIASEDSALAVELHLKDCPSCARLFEGELPPPSDAKNVLFHKLKRKRILHGTILSLLVVSLVLSAVILTWYTEQRYDETMYMKSLYHDLTDCNELAEYISTVQGEPTEMYARLCYSLMALNEKMRDGHSYVSNSLNSSSGSLFVEAAAELTHSLTEDGKISPETNAIALSLHEDLESILSQLTGPDGMHLNPDIEIKEFSKILFDVYRSFDPIP